MRASIAVINPKGDAQGVASAFRRAAPEIEVEIWPEIRNSEAVVTCACWAPPGNVFTQFPQLRLAASLGAGADQLLQEPSLRPEVRVTRVLDPGMAETMAKYVLAMTLNIERGLLQHFRNQHRHIWEERGVSSPISAGVLGLGHLGSEILRTLERNGYETRGFRRSAGVDGKTFSGKDGLAALCARSNLIVCCLPLTAETRNFLDDSFFSLLNPGTALIHVGRGEQLDVDALLRALDTGILDAAVLDVFPEEPLPPGHPLWDHPKVTVTPHIASFTNRGFAVEQILANHRRAAAGEPVLGALDRSRGY